MVLAYPPLFDTLDATVVFASLLLREFMIWDILGLCVKKGGLIWFNWLSKQLLLIILHRVCRFASRWRILRDAGDTGFPAQILGNLGHNMSSQK